MSTEHTQARLDEYDKTEWQDIARKLMPGLTSDAYEELWEDFQKAKAEHERTKGMQ